MDKSLGPLVLDLCFFVNTTSDLLPRICDRSRLRAPGFGTYLRGMRFLIALLLVTLATASVAQQSPRYDSLRINQNANPERVVASGQAPGGGAYVVARSRYGYLIIYQIDSTGTKQNSFTTFSVPQGFQYARIMIVGGPAASWLLFINAGGRSIYTAEIDDSYSRNNPHIFTLPDHSFSRAVVNRDDGRLAIQLARTRDGVKPMYAVRTPKLPGASEYPYSIEGSSQGLFWDDRGLVSVREIGGRLRLRIRDYPRDTTMTEVAVGGVQTDLSDFAPNTNYLILVGPGGQELFSCRKELGSPKRLTNVLYNIRTGEERTFVNTGQYLLNGPHVLPASGGAILGTFDEGRWEARLDLHAASSPGVITEIPLRTSSVEFVPLGRRGERLLTVTWSEPDDVWPVRRVEGTVVEVRGAQKPVAYSEPVQDFYGRYLTSIPNAEGGIEVGWFDNERFFHSRVNVTADSLYVEEETDLGYTRQISDAFPRYLMGTSDFLSGGTDLGGRFYSFAGYSTTRTVTYEASDTSRFWSYTNYGPRYEGGEVLQLVPVQGTRGTMLEVLKVNGAYVLSIRDFATAPVRTRRIPSPTGADFPEVRRFFRGEVRLVGSHIVGVLIGNFINTDRRGDVVVSIPVDGSGPALVIGETPVTHRNFTRAWSTRADGAATFTLVTTDVAGGHTLLRYDFDRDGVLVASMQTEIDQSSFPARTDSTYEKATFIAVTAAGSDVTYVLERSHDYWTTGRHYEAFRAYESAAPGSSTLKGTVLSFDEYPEKHRAPTSTPRLMGDKLIFTDNVTTGERSAAVFVIRRKVRTVLSSTAASPRLPTFEIVANPPYGGILELRGLRTGSVGTGLTYAIVDVRGARLRSGTWPADEPSLRIPVDGLPAGAYVIQVQGHAAAPFIIP